MQFVFYLRWDVDCFTGQVGPPDHQIRICSNPKYTAQEAYDKESLP